MRPVPSRGAQEALGGAPPGVDQLLADARPPHALGAWPERCGALIIYTSGTTGRPKGAPPPRPARQRTESSEHARALGHNAQAESEPGQPCPAAAPQPVRRMGQGRPNNLRPGNAAVPMPCGPPHGAPADLIQPTRYSLTDLPRTRGPRATHAEAPRARARRAAHARQPGVACARAGRRLALDRGGPHPARAAAAPRARRHKCAALRARRGRRRRVPAQLLAGRGLALPGRARPRGARTAPLRLACLPAAPSMARRRVAACLRACADASWGLTRRWVPPGGTIRPSCPRATWSTLRRFSTKDTACCLEAHGRNHSISGIIQGRVSRHACAARSLGFQLTVRSPPSLQAPALDIAHGVGGMKRAAGHGGRNVDPPTCPWPRPAPHAALAQHRLA